MKKSEARKQIRWQRTCSKRKNIDRSCGTVTFVRWWNMIGWAPSEEKQERKHAEGDMEDVWETDVGVYPRVSRPQWSHRETKLGGHMHDPCPHVSPIKNSVPRVYPAWRRPPVEQFNLTVVLLRYCRNVRPTWVKFNSKDTKESEWVFRGSEY